MTVHKIIKQNKQKVNKVLMIMKKTLLCFILLTQICSQNLLKVTTPIQTTSVKTQVPVPPSATSGSSPTPLQQITSQVSTTKSSDNSGSESQQTEAICYDNSCSYHWVFALDKSGSMSGLKWENLKILVQRIASHLQALGNQFLTVYTFEYRASFPPSQYIQYSRPSLWSTDKLPSSAGGGTDFGQPLIRAIQFILLHKDSNTCFVMLTDGQAEYPEFQIELFNHLKNFMIRKGKEFCSLCYFIKNSNGAEPPKNFVNLCRDIGSIEIQSNEVAEQGGSRSGASSFNNGTTYLLAADSSNYQDVFYQSFKAQSSFAIQAAKAPQLPQVPQVPQVSQVTASTP